MGEDGRVNDPYDLLIGHAAAWAAKTKRPLDADLLGTALSIRDTQDRIPGTAWLAGSADYLMTTRWPGHGPLGVPDIVARRHAGHVLAVPARDRADGVRVGRSQGPDAGGSARHTDDAGAVR